MASEYIRTVIMPDLWGNNIKNLSTNILVPYRIPTQNHFITQHKIASNFAAVGNTVHTPGVTVRKLAYWTINKFETDKATFFFPTGVFVRYIEGRDISRIAINRNAVQQGISPSFASSKCGWRNIGVSLSNDLCRQMFWFWLYLTF